MQRRLPRRPGDLFRPLQTHSSVKKGQQAQLPEPEDVLLYDCRELPQVSFVFVAIEKHLWQVVCEVVPFGFSHWLMQLQKLGRCLCLTVTLPAL